MSSFKKLWLTGLLALVSLTTSISNSSAQTIVGTGDSFSYLVIEATQFSSTPFVFEWHYNYDPLTPLTTADMLSAIEAASTGFTFELLYGGTFLDGITYSSMTLTNATEEPYSPFWAQWVSGGESGDPLAPVPSGFWSEGYGITYRTLAPGSWDGLIFNGAYDPVTYALISAPPSVAPVPEPRVIYLALAGGLVAYFIRRSRHEKTSV